jgi:serine/tyrosine/threonine adenylyltransferase
VDVENLTSTTEWALVELRNHKNFEDFVNFYKQALESEGRGNEERKEIMCSVNPCYVLRNWMAQESIKRAEDGDYTLVQLIEKILQKPYTRQEHAEKLGFSGKPPYWEKQLKVSCSS